MALKLKVEKWYNLHIALSEEAQSLEGHLNQTVLSQWRMRGKWSNFTTTSYVCVVKYLGAEFLIYNG